MDEPAFIEFSRDEVDDDGHDVRSPKRGVVALLAGAACFAGLVVVASIVVGGDGDRAGRGVTTTIASTTTTPVLPASIPLGVAECYESDPNADRLRSVLDAIGGLESLHLGRAEGAFDVVTFDPLDADHLVAARRSGYGPARNEELNEVWRVGDGVVAQSIWNGSTPHDFGHFNTDGTTTMWIHSGDTVGYAPRDAVIIGRDGDIVTTSVAPIYAARFAVDSGTVFALTGDPDWYTARDTGYFDLLAVDGERVVRLASGGDYAWIDVPAPGLVVAYPADDGGVTAVWDTATLAPLPSHPLAGRTYRRAAIAADGTTALGVTFEGRLEPVDLVGGTVGPRFGRVDVIEVDRPVVLNEDGTVAFTVETTGRVSVWFVGDDTPVATVDGGYGLSRWLQSTRASRLTSALAPDASRIAVRVDASPGVDVSWLILDTDIGSWLDRARRTPSGRC